jgi:hypothetical protein
VVEAWVLRPFFPVGSAAEKKLSYLSYTTTLRPHTLLAYGRIH